MFCEAEQLLQREGSQSHAQLAELLQGSFSLLCDVKDAGGDKYYRLNDEKARPAFFVLKAVPHMDVQCVTPRWSTPPSCNCVLYMHSLVGGSGCMGVTKLMLPCRCWHGYGAR